METVRLIHFADLHLGVEAGGRPNPQSGLNQRIHDVLDRLDELCDVAEAEGVHAVVFAGDAFKHQHPTPTLQKLLAQRIRRLAKAGRRVFLLVGNHDLPKMAALAHPFSIYDALEVEGVVVGEKAQIYRLPLARTELQIAALPHFSRQQVLARLGDELAPDDAEKAIEDAIDTTVRRLGEQVDPAMPAIFAGHCHVNQADVTATAQSLFGVSELEVPLSSLVTQSTFPYYALGHIHRRQVLQREPFVAYSGSLERVDFSEGESVRITERGVKRTAAEEKGFYRVDLVRRDGTWQLAQAPEFRTVGARNFLTVRVDEPLGMDPTNAALDAINTARDAGARLEGAFVKLVACLDAADRGRLNYGTVRDAVPEAYDIRLAIDVREDAARLRDPRFAERMSEIQALERYVEARDDWADDRPDLLRLGRSLIDEVVR